MRSIIGIATLLGIVAIFAVWANRQLLSTDGWTSTSTELIESPPIREAVSGYVTDQIYANVNVAGELRNSLPTQFKPLAAPAAGALRSVVQKGVNFALERPRVQQLWRKVNETAHAQFVKLIENKGTVIKLPGEGTVVLDLGPLVTEGAKRVGVPASAVEKIPPNVAEVQVVKSKSLQTMQTAVNILRSLAIALPLLALFLYALAVYLARGRRAQTVIAVGAALIFAGVLVLIARSLLGKTVVDSLASTESVRPAVEAVWSIGTGMLAAVAGAVVFVGVPVMFAGMLGGPSRAALSLRRSMAPYLRDQPGLAFGVVGVLLIILFAWGPIPATRNWLGILIIIALSLFGAQMLRRQTAAEFPDAQAGPPGGLRRRLTALLTGGHAAAGAQTGADGQGFRGDGANLSGAARANGPAVGTQEAGQNVPPAAPAAAPVHAAAADLPAQLQSLTALHDSGALTDAEYAAAKQRLLMAPSG